MKAKITKTDNDYCISIPKEYIEKLNLQQNEYVDISFNLELTQIIIGSQDYKNIENNEADEDF